jgi:hypothetical protein
MVWQGRTDTGADQSHLPGVSRRYSRPLIFGGRKQHYFQLSASAAAFDHSIQFSGYMYEVVLYFEVRWGRGSLGGLLMDRGFTVSAASPLHCVVHVVLILVPEQLALPRGPNWSGDCPGYVYEATLRGTCGQCRSTPHAQYVPVLQSHTVHPGQAPLSR